MTNKNDPVYEPTRVSPFNLAILLTVGMLILYFAIGFTIFLEQTNLSEAANIASFITVSKIPSALLVAIIMYFADSKKYNVMTISIWYALFFIIVQVATYIALNKGEEISSGISLIEISKFLFA